MAATINTNIASINAQRNLHLSGQSLTTTMQRLSSGLRVNSAKDDAAGLAIAERMNTQVKGLTVAARNANDGISLAQTAEGALGKVGDMLQRMRELAVQASNATNSASDRVALQAEVKQLAAEIDRVAKQTNFNGQKILDGSFAGAVFQVGANSGDNVTLGTLADTRSSQISTIHYATTTLKSIDTDDTTDPANPAIKDLALGIPAGQLVIDVGNGSFNIPLEKIEPANSSLERLGQVITAINNKTADTGLTAYMTANPGTRTYDITFVSERLDANQQPMSVNFQGFTSSTTGIGYSVDAPVTPLPTDSGLDTTPVAAAANAADAIALADPIAAEIKGTSLATADATLAAAITAYDDAIADGPADETEVAAALDTLIAAYTTSHSSNSPAQITPLPTDPALDTTPVATAANAADAIALADPIAAEIKGTSLATADATLAAAITAYDDAIADGPADETEVAAALDTLIAAYTTSHAAAPIESPMDMNDADEFKTNQRGIEDIDVTTQTGAWIALKKIDSAIDQVNASRATLGAMQSRFENAVNNIDIQVENLSAARGRIVDADFAVETANLSRTQILQQAGTAMVAQANQIPQNVLQLLQS